MELSSQLGISDSSKPAPRKTPRYLEIEIPGFDKYNPRADGLNRSWIRLQNSLWSDPVFNSMPMNARGTYMALICLAGDRNSARIGIAVGLHSASIGLKPGVYWACTRLLHDFELIVIHAESFNSTFALSAPTDGRTNERTDGRTGDEPAKPDESSESKEEIKPLFEHPALDMETRLKPGFGDFEKLLRESNLGSPEILRQAPKIFRRFEHDVDRFQLWAEEYAASRAAKAVRGKPDGERRRAFKIALLGECGLLTPKREAKP